MKITAMGCVDVNADWGAWPRLGVPRLVLELVKEKRVGGPGFLPGCGW